MSHHEEITLGTPRHLAEAVTEDNVEPALPRGGRQNWQLPSQNFAIENSIHRSLETVTAMHQLWDRNRVICRSTERSRNADPPIEDFAQNWSAHSPDLAPCDQFLFGFMKGKILTLV